MLGISW